MPADFVGTDGLVLGPRYQTLSEMVVTETNMVQVLGTIEQVLVFCSLFHVPVIVGVLTALAVRLQLANEVLQEYGLARDLLATSAVHPAPETIIDPLETSQLSTSPIVSPSKSLVTILGTGPTVPMGQDVVQIQPPGLDDYSTDDGSDDDARPLTREELTARTLNKMQRQSSKDKVMWRENC